MTNRPEYSNADSLGVYALGRRKVVPLLLIPSTPLNHISKVEPDRPSSNSSVNRKYSSCSKTSSNACSWFNWVDAFSITYSISFSNGRGHEMADRRI